MSIGRSDILNGILGTRGMKFDVVNGKELIYITESYCVEFRHVCELMFIHEMTREEALDAISMSQFTTG